MAMYWNSENVRHVVTPHTEGRRVIRASEQLTVGVDSQSPRIGEEIEGPTVEIPEAEADGVFEPVFPKSASAGAPEEVEGNNNMVFTRWPDGDGSSGGYIKCHDCGKETYFHGDMFENWVDVHSRAGTSSACSTLSQNNYELVGSLHTATEVTWKFEIGDDDEGRVRNEYGEMTDTFQLRVFPMGSETAWSVYDSITGDVPATGMAPNASAARAAAELAVEDLMLRTAGRKVATTWSGSDGDVSASFRANGKLYFAYVFPEFDDYEDLPTGYAWTIMEDGGDVVAESSSPKSTSAEAQAEAESRISQITGTTAKSKQAISDSTQWESYEGDDPDGSWEDIDNWLNLMQTDPSRGQEERDWNRQQTDTYNQNAYDEFRDVPIHGKRKQAQDSGGELVQWEYVNDGLRKSQRGIYQARGKDGKWYYHSAEGRKVRCGKFDDRSIGDLFGTPKVCVCGANVDYLFDGTVTAGRSYASTTRTAGYRYDNWRDESDTVTTYEDASLPSENPRARIEHDPLGNVGYGESEVTIWGSDGQVVSQYFELWDDFSATAERDQVKRFIKENADSTLQELYALQSPGADQLTLWSSRDDDFQPPSHYAALEDWGRVDPEREAMDEYARSMPMNSNKAWWDLTPEEQDTYYERAGVTRESSVRTAGKKTAMGWWDAIEDPRHVVAGWSWDEKLSGYIAEGELDFSCSCGAHVAAPGHTSCICGRLWNSYPIVANGQTRLVAREVPVRDGVMLASRQHTADSIRRVQDEAYWGLPKGTPIKPGQKPQGSGSEEPERAPTPEAEEPAAQPEPEKLPPLSDEEMDQRIEEVQAKVDQALADGFETQLYYAGEGGRGTYTAERRREQRRLIGLALSRAGGDHIPREGKAVMSGGLGGAGKSTILKDPNVGIDQKNYLTINADDVKELMAELGMIPEIEGCSPMELAALVHEESSDIATFIAFEAYRNNTNVIWDLTMGSTGSIEKRLAHMREAGYTQIDAVFVDIPVEKSVERAIGRYKGGVERYRNGKGAGGRYVPPHIIRKNNPSEGSEFNSKNREVFEKLKEQFDNSVVYDNSGGPGEQKKVTGVGRWAYRVAMRNTTRYTEGARPTDQGKRGTQ